jgi:hypothetical protein
MGLIALLACSTEVEVVAPSELIFVRDGVLVDAPVAGSRPAGDRHLLERPWEPGQVVSIAGLEATAPRQAECLSLFSVPLGDVSELVAMGGASPTTAMAFDPAGDRLAVGSHRGELVVVDAWTGQELARRGLSEALVKWVAWSPSGDTLYAAEQSPDAFVHALDPATLESRWRLRLADIVETSPMPSAEETYGIYDLPGSYGLLVLEGGELIVAAMHGWNTDAGRRNAGQILKVSPSGEILQRWPSEPAEAMFRHPVTDGENLVFSVSSSSSSPDLGMPIGGVQVLDLESLAPVGSAQVQPLKPWYDNAFAWDAVGISGGRTFMGFGDGRVRVHDLSGVETLALDVGTPILSGEVPISATIGHGRLLQDSLVFITSRTVIPWGAASPELRPPTAHPRANGVFVHGLDGELRWTWTGEQELDGMDVLGDSLLVGAGPRATDQRRDLYGGLVFSLESQQLQAFCPTEGPVFFRQAQSPGGAIALAEFPYVNEDGSQGGAYRVTVLR